MSTKLKPPLIAIVGPTASGKTSLGIAIAQRFNGEIISADSRQVYRGMDIGTGKATKAEQRAARHHLLDVTSPTHEYTVAQFQRDAKRAIADVYRRGKLPILVGGTGFWIEALIDDLALPKVKPNPALRKRLEKLSTDKLYTRLKRLDPVRAQTIDRHNPYRLIRAIEIVIATGKPVPPKRKKSPYRLLMLGIALPKKKLHRLIAQRLKKRLRQGMIAEVRRLHREGVSWSRLEAFGMEYRYVARYLRGLLSRHEMEQQLQTAIEQYAKRQLTWFRRDKRIHWIDRSSEAIQLTKRFI